MNMLNIDRPKSTFYKTFFSPLKFVVDLLALAHTQVTSTPNQPLKVNLNIVRLSVSS